MSDTRSSSLLAQVTAGKLTRRGVLEAGLKLGVATPALLALIEATPAGANAVPAAGHRLLLAQESSPGTLMILIQGGDEDIDPHYSYSTLSSVVALGVYEPLIRLKGDTSDEFEGMMAESWEVSDDQSTYTFKLYPDMQFQDGTPANAQAVKDSYTRWIEMGGSPVGIITRFVESPDMMEVVDELTIRFNLGTPQPLFLAAMASSYGPMVISPTALAENATEEDPYAHEWAKEFAIGSGAYILESNSINEGIVFKKFDNYHRGWEGNHFDTIIMRVVPEDGARRQLLERGEADAAAYNLTFDAVDALRSNPEVQVVEYPSTAVSWTVMNAPRLLTPEVRQGFSYAFPYDDVVNAVYKGLMKRSGPITDNVKGYDPDVFIYETDLEKAKDLIISGGFKEGDTFEYMFDSTSASEQTIAELFQANVAQMGFNLELTAVDIATLNSVAFGDAPPEDRPHFIGSWGWWPDYNDPYAHEWAKEFAIGSGAYIREANSITEGLVFKKFDTYHRGWEG
ncbi:MAG: ABC transporter substrate-binding protein, partial [Chloroflexia bacterium]|nr:ABC transporter substrate-binding protein [Chloroflexia bacterium]